MQNRHLMEYGLRVTEVLVRVISVVSIVCAIIIVVSLFININKSGVLYQFFVAVAAILLINALAFFVLYIFRGALGER
jgi:hypothetical protein